MDEFKKACLSNQLMLQQFWMHSSSSNSTSFASPPEDEDMKTADLDRELNCRDCKKTFVFDVASQQVPLRFHICFQEFI
jgi:hypothetical protein